MKLRHELKHEITHIDRLVLLSRLSAVMKPDSHASGGSYRVRSLYFDTPGDNALRDKIDGLNIREKFRIRCYNHDTSYIVLEKKSKFNGLYNKIQCQISKEETEKLLNGDISWMIDNGRELLTEFYSKMIVQGLRPKTIVEYNREPFIFLPGNVRVTIDSNIKTGIFRTDFLNPETLTLPAGDSLIILEVKWDEYLPEIIKDAVNLPKCRSCAFSKYKQSRIYG